MWYSCAVIFSDARSTRRNSVLSQTKISRMLCDVTAPRSEIAVSPASYTTDSNAKSLWRLSYKIVPRC